MRTKSLVAALVQLQVQDLQLKEVQHRLVLQLEVLADVQLDHQLMATAVVGLLAVAEAIIEVTTVLAQVGLRLVVVAVLHLEAVEAIIEEVVVVQVGLLPEAEAVLRLAEVTAQVEVAAVQAGLLLEAEVVLLEVAEVAAQVLLVVDEVTKKADLVFQTLVYTV